MMLTSCTVEYKLARQFVEHAEKPAVMYISPDYVFKSNLKKDLIKNHKELDEFELDSTLFFNSSYLQFIDDSILLSKFNNRFLDEMKALGIETFSEFQMDTFLVLDKPAFILNIAQMELEEYIQEYRDEEVFDDYLYYKEIDLNSVGLNVWFEFSRMNREDDEPIVLYASHYVMDGYSGQFRYYPFSGELSYDYSIDSLNVQDIYDLAGFLGEKYAGYTYDFLMNIYIYSNAPEDVKPELYYHYDRKRNAFIPVDDDRFKPVE